MATALRTVPFPDQLNKPLDTHVIVLSYVMTARHIVVLSCAGCLIGPDVSIGQGCVIGNGVRLSNCVIMRGVSIQDHSKVCVCVCARARVCVRERGRGDSHVP